MKASLIYTIILSFVLCLTNTNLASAENEVQLKGIWKFRVGDRMDWATTGYDDSDWDDIRVPARWENEGYHGYDGFAWYRIHVKVPEVFDNRLLELHLGYIDDCDEVYINGVKVGQSGAFPPQVATAYNAKRVYKLSGEHLHFGEENLIAVRVYDSQLEGGMVSGDFKLVALATKPQFEVDLSDEWMFNKGREYDKESAKPIQVPGIWENQGYNNYDGYAVYSKSVFISNEVGNKRLVLMAGRIDDVDQVYINGKFVGETGQFKHRDGATMCDEFRNYFIPIEFVNGGQDNLIEIRVHDDRGEGGIVEGPIGIITQDKFREYWKSKRRN
ncbi:hypothetical protein ACUNWD_16415 [Sunxiuqinia sp. A32]|uniref:hypothetical protein n=1 Tax=Sunxiuqinia sp. A32 TaxID=3461496 RepID=UPI00404583AD